jgi:hypothetical protein
MRQNDIKANTCSFNTLYISIFRAVNLSIISVDNSSYVSEKIFEQGISQMAHSGTSK